MEARATKTIVAFFGGTGYDFDRNAKGYVSQTDLEVTRPETNERNDDISFSILNDSLHKDQERLGYDGCHQRGGGVFAYGVEQPVQHLYNKLKRELKDADIKVTLVLTAHSRGCLSALALAKKLNADKDLKNQVDVILDLRDPVPGNFKVTSATPLAKYATAAHQLKDLRSCTNIKSVNVTVQEKGILDFAFDVLIPQFSPETRFEVNFIPGAHDIQERNANGVDFYRHPQKGYILASPLLHLLGVCQSLKLYSDNNVRLDYKSCLNNFRDYLQGIQSLNSNLDYLRALIQAIDDLAWIPIQKEVFYSFLEKAQLVFYDEILKECKRRPDLKIQNRHLHFGGEFQTVGDLQSATHLNLQHALLAEKYQIIAEPVLLLGFQGKRFDLSRNERAAKALEDLRKECESYLKYYENKEISADKIAVVKNLYNLVKQPPGSPAFEIKVEKLKVFSEVFHQNKSVFKNPDTRTRRFVTVVSHILASLVTAGIYAGVRALRSSVSKGSAKFWQTRDEILIEKLSESQKSQEYGIKESKPSS
jgi:hypothetical protein